ncbi:MAG: NAD(P)H-dependent oxidoreductase [Saprospiraceae bacterium]|nr:NAD(P)H-dependent oxidoreductase [Saprospiraceae bacterium]
MIIVGSATRNSSNGKLAALIQRDTAEIFDCIIFDDLRSLPHFDPEQSIENTPSQIVKIREEIEKAEGVIICTPEYVFSIPSGLKNMIEWCVSTTVFSDKPLGIITASAHGKKGHDELKMIMQTVMADFNDSTTLLISGIRGKLSERGELLDDKTRDEVRNFTIGFQRLVEGL